MMKFAGIVVTYNRKEELIKNIESVLDQDRTFDQFYIIDNNSSDGTNVLLQDSHVLENGFVKYVRLSENVGGAGGFSEGIRQAVKDGCDLIYLMDDDGRPMQKDTVEIIYEAAVNAIKTDKKMLMLNSLVTYDGNNLSFGFGNVTTVAEAEDAALSGMLMGLINPFNGTLLTKELVDKIGYPNKDFFIRGDEVDYQSRAQKVGAYIATVTASKYYHPTFEMFPVKWMGRKVYIGTCNPWKSYYQIRNYVYRRKRDEGVFSAVKEYVFQKYCAWKVNPEYAECKPFMWRGFVDGMRGKLGPTVKPGQTTI